MSQSFHIESATVLNREIRAEDMLYIVAFSKEFGLLQMMKKISAKKSSQMPDIFDDIAAHAEADSPTSLKFMRDFEILKRRTSIGENYECFNQAARVADCVLKNGRNIEDTAKLSMRLTKTLDAFAKNLPPAIVHIKFLYLLTRDEGYAVREDFYENLRDAQKSLFAMIIKTPADDMREFESRAEEMLGKLSRWIADNTDIILDA